MRTYITLWIGAVGCAHGQMVEQRPLRHLRHGNDRPDLGMTKEKVNIVRGNKKDKKMDGGLSQEDVGNDLAFRKPSDTLLKEVGKVGKQRNLEGMSDVAEELWEEVWEAGPAIFPIDSVDKVLSDLTQIVVLDGVGLPKDVKNMPFGKKLTNLLQGSTRTNEDVLSFISEVDSDFYKKQRAWFESNEREKDLRTQIPANEARTSPLLLSLFDDAINEIIKNNPNDADPAQGYFYFGNRDFKTILSMLCQVNPFFASALTVSHDQKHLELKAFTDEPEQVQEPLYLSLMRELTDDSHSINAKFDKSMNLVEISKFDSKSGKAVVVNKDKWDYYSSGILYNLMFYASAIHANMHILHYLMCACIVVSTHGTNKSMEKWAEIYDDNIAIKFVQVAGLLFDSTFLGESFSIQDGPPSKKLVSGEDGFGASSKMMPKIKAMLKLFGECKDAKKFTEKFLHRGIYMTAKDNTTAEKFLREANILSQFNKFAQIVPEFATKLTTEMQNDDLEAFEKTEEKIKSFMKACGKNVSSIETLSSWVQLMSMTGIVHGSTLSYSRMFIIPEVMRWRNITVTKWDEDDFSLMNGGAGTMVGMTLDRHVFTSSIQHGDRWDTEDISRAVFSVLEDYENRAEKLKTEYTNDIEKRADFREYGWILTDFCNDGYDGKQQTITTYI